MLGTGHPRSGDDDVLQTLLLHCECWGSGGDRGMAQGSSCERMRTFQSVSIFRRSSFSLVTPPMWHPQRGTLEAPQPVMPKVLGQSWILTPKQRCFAPGELLLLWGRS